MQKQSSKTEHLHGLEVDQLVAIGQRVSSLIEISGSTSNHHYLIAKIACHWITQDSDFRDVVSFADIQHLAILNECLHDCQAIHTDPDAIE